MLARVFGVVLLFLSLQASAVECLMNAALKDPELSANSAFWDDYAKLAAKGEPSAKDMQALVEKYKPSAGSAPVERAQAPSTTSGSSSSAPLISNTYNIQHRAEKDIKKLNKDLQQDVDEFLTIATRPGGFKEIQNNPGKWRYEQVGQFGKEAHTVRLNGGYRILFDLDKKSHHLEIRMVNKDKIHGN